MKNRRPPLNFYEKRDILDLFRLGRLALNRTFNPAVIIIEVAIVLFILWTLCGNKVSRHFFEG